MASVDHQGAAAEGTRSEPAEPAGAAGGAGGASDETGDTDSHWVRWHRAYEDPESFLSLRLRVVQSMVRAFLDSEPVSPSGSIRIVSMCAGQGRDVIDVVSTHPRRHDVSALLVELDPDLVAFARGRVAAAGLAGQIHVVEGDASLCHLYEDLVPADLVLVCGVFGNISREDIAHTIQTLPGFCRNGSEVVWTRHRRAPDITPGIRADFAASGFEEVAFEAPDGYILSVGRHRLDGAPSMPFDPTVTLFDFVGDGALPA